jgi:thymidine phosphorylase
MVVHKKIGDRVEAGEPLCTLHYNSDARLAEARRLVEQAYLITPAPPAATPPLVHRVIGA